LGAFTLKSCETKQTKIIIKKKEILFSDFELFPHKIYLQLDVKHTYNKNRIILIESGFKQVDSRSFFREKDSTSFIFPSQNEASEYIIYLKSKYYLQNKLTFYDFIKRFSEDCNGNAKFSILYFSDFYLSFFREKQYIRLFIKSYAKAP